MITLQFFYTAFFVARTPMFFDTTFDRAVQLVMAYGIADSYSLLGSVFIFILR